MSTSVPSPDQQPPDVNDTPDPPAPAPTHSQMVDATAAYVDGVSPRRDATGPRATDFLRPPEAPDELGRLGNYRVLRELGAGGMGLVFVAEDVQLKRPAALKIMLPSLGDDGAVRKRFLREAQAAAAIRHEHIVTIYQVGEDRGIPFLAMELLQGETLEARLLRDGRLPIQDTLRIGRQIADGLAAAHAAGMIHRDIKPGNIFLESVVRRPSSSSRQQPAADHDPVTGCRVKLLDFGLARREEGDMQLTRTGMALGTPHYMAPEQAAGENVDKRCDLFSLGCVLYRMTAGQLPFAGTNMRALLKAVMFDAPRPVRELDPDLPPALATLIEGLMAKEPNDRPQSADEVLASLAALESELAGGPPSSLVGTSAGVAKNPGPARSMAQPRTPSRRRWIAAGAALLVLAAIVAGVLQWWKPLTPAVDTSRLEADGVLKQLVGNWDFRIDPETSQPVPAAVHGTTHYEWIANQKFLRAYTTRDGGPETLSIYQYDPRARLFRRWSFSSDAGPLAIQGPADGHFDAAAQTLTWRDSLPLFHKLFAEDRWTGGNDVESRIEITNNSGDVAQRLTIKNHRITTDDVVGPGLPREPKGPAQAAVLDVLIGTWNTTADVTLAELGNRKVKSESTQQGKPILAGRFIEGHDYSPTVGRHDHWLVCWDGFRTTYRLWHFGADGDAMETNGTWDSKERTLSWKSLDGRFTGTWTLSNANERHAVMAARDAQGRRVFEVVTESRRADSTPR
jgi:serine/threonine protein kinase